MKRTASVGAILHGHRPVKFRDRNVFATLLFGIFCVVVFEMMFFVFFSSRERTSGSRRSRRELPFERTNNEVVMSSSSKWLAVDRTKRETVPAGGCDDERVGRVGDRGETDVRE